MSAVDLIAPLVVASVCSPALVVAALGFAALFGRRPSEQLTGALTSVGHAAALACLLGVALMLVRSGEPRFVVSFGSLFDVAHAAFRVELVADGLSLAFAMLTVVVGGVVGAFSHRYLHREPGYHRFFVLLATFIAGMLLVVLAGTVELLFTGWEMLGLSSALLVAFFHDRPAPVRNALRVFVVYRVGDAAMLSAAIVAHHALGTGSLAVLFGHGGGGPVLSTAQATAVGLLLVVAAAGKCAQLPFSGWLPRAMEGPTPSGAIFYGALSVHAGAYLLLRASPLLDESALARGVLVALGLATALFATVVGRVQTDIKSALAFASLTQVGIILVEIGLGLVWIPAVHMISHACLRVLQFLRAPSLLQDFHQAENAAGRRPEGRAGRLAQLLGPSATRWLYRFALERGYVDAVIDRFVVRPFVVGLRACDALERKWCDVVAGQRDEEGSKASAPLVEGERHA